MARMVLAIHEPIGRNRGLLRRKVPSLWAGTQLQTSGSTTPKCPVDTWS